MRRRAAGPPPRPSTCAARSPRRCRSRSLPLLLMIVSMQIDVLPVWRSPMISSRWPRPTFVIASIGLMPVSIGSFTGWRWTTPGALNSAGRVSVVLMSPLPSSGLPSGSTMRPSSSSPTGTSSRRPVRLTWSPSSILSHSPNSTAPTLSDSRLSARPVTSCGSSSSSIDMQLSRPCTREMPSAIERTVPTSDRSAPPSSSPSMRCLRMLVISSGLICTSKVSLAPRRPWPPACVAVRVCCGRWRRAPCCPPAPQAPEHVGIDAARQLDLPAGLLLDLARRCPRRSPRRARPRSSPSPAAACSPRPTGSRSARRMRNSAGIRWRSASSSRKLTRRSSASVDDRDRSPSFFSSDEK